MKTFGAIKQARLREIVSRFPSLRIGVLGDFFLDKYLDVDPAIAEVSVETGKTAHQVVSLRHSPGAAGTVVSNLAALAAGSLYAIGYTGEDGESRDLRADLDRMRCSSEHLHVAADRMTPTYLKPRNVDEASLAGEHERYDTKNRTATPAAIEELVISSLDALLGRLDAVIIADQVEADDCGAVTAKVRSAISQRAGRFERVVFWADSRAHAGRFRDVIVKPNQFEAVGREKPLPGEEVPLEALVGAIKRLRGEVGAPIFTTCGARGMIVSDPEFVMVPAVRIEGEIDITGAGDASTAGAVLALAAGAGYPEAALVGNLVASITIQQLAATGTARPEELPRRLEMWLRQRAEDDGADVS